MMKRKGLGVMLLALVAGFSACKDGDDAIVPELGTVEWIKQNEDKIVNEIFARMEANGAEAGKEYKKNIIEGDLNHEVALMPRGYDGLNEGKFATEKPSPTAYIDNVFLVRFIEKKVKAGFEHGGTAILLSGTVSSGKSTAVKTNETLKELNKKADLIYDDTFLDTTRLKSTVELLEKNGFTDITIVLVYCDPKTSYFAACERLYKTGRTICIPFFEYMYPQFQGRIEFMERNFKDRCNRVYLNNTYYNCKNNAESEYVTKGSPKTIVSDNPTPGKPWCYVLGPDDLAYILQIGTAWQHGSFEPYILWKTLFEFNPDNKYKMDFGNEYDESNIDWKKYPIDKNSSFKICANPEKAKESIFKNLMY